MAEEIKTQTTFGTATIDHFSPPKDDEWRHAINIHVSVEEATQLHLGLDQLLGKLNSYNRATTQGR